MDELRCELNASTRRRVRDLYMRLPCLHRVSSDQEYGIRSIRRAVMLFCLHGRHDFSRPQPADAHDRDSSSKLEVGNHETF